MITKSKLLVLHLDSLRVLRAAGGLPDISWQYADFVGRLATGDSADADPRLVLAALMASVAVENSHVCIDLARLYASEADAVYPSKGQASGDVGETDEDEQLRVVLPPRELFLTFLRSEACREVVGHPATATTVATPLVLDDKDRLYLHRYWVKEHSLAMALLAFVSGEGKTPALPMPNDTDLIRTCLSELFPAPKEEDWKTNWQKVAAYAALTHRLTVITGGPGTGKTSVVGKLLLLIRELCCSEDNILKIRLAAPTGKAAARLAQGLEECFQDLKKDATQRGKTPVDTEKGLVVEASTLHRLLGYKHNSIHFRHDAGSPLDADLIIVDEASMVTLPQMLRLIDAVPKGARLILLGDHQQLASVESGFVLGDLHEAMQAKAFSAGFLSGFARVAGDRGDNVPCEGRAGTLSDCCIELTYSWRFRPGSQIYRVSEAINKSNSKAALAAEAESSELQTELRDWATEPGILVPLEADEIKDWSDGNRTQVWHRRNVPPVLVRRGRPDARLAGAGHLHRRYNAFLKETNAAAALAAFETFRILCATRTGPHGVAALNEFVESVLGLDYAADRANEKNQLGTVCLAAKSDRKGHYDHRPILITQNNYGLNLFNGDTGVILANPEYEAKDKERQKLPKYLAWFPPAADAKDKAPRSFVPEMLPTHDTAWAMTIHKSQGSQFSDVLIVLPHRDSPVVGRELIYTGITRARRRVELWLPPKNPVSQEDVLFDLWVARSTDRDSGLVDALTKSTS